MKRSILGSLAFVAALGLGVIVGSLFVYRDTSPDSTDADPSTSQITPSVAAVETEEHLEVFDDSSREPSFSCELLETGPAFHADQIAVRSGEKWLGVFIDNSRTALRSTKIKVRPVPDERLHGPNTSDRGKITGKSVSVTDAAEPLFLVKNARQIRPSVVTTLFVGERRRGNAGTNRITFLDKNFRRTFELAGKTYELKVAKAQNLRSERILALLLEGDGKRQLLHTFWTRSEGEYGEREWLGSVGELYWAGDLDHDNKPDFYLSLFAHETIYEAYLLLSSEAGENELVKKAALFRTSGCG